MEGNSNRPRRGRNPEIKEGVRQEHVGLRGATLVSSLLNLSLIDELHLMVNPPILGGGKALFKDVKDRHSLKLVRAKPLKTGKVSLIYDTQSLDAKTDLRSSNRFDGIAHPQFLIKNSESLIIQKNM